LSEIEPKPALTGIEKGGIIVEESIFSNHDTVHTWRGGAPQMARDEARHGKAFAGLLKRYFGK